jgi:hypothetical protein
MKVPEDIKEDIAGADGNQDHQGSLPGNVVIHDGDGERIEVHDLPADLQPGHRGLIEDPIPFINSIVTILGHNSPLT